jgi:hypothetical protein
MERGRCSPTTSTHSTRDRDRCCFLGEIISVLVEMSLSSLGALTFLSSKVTCMSKVVVESSEAVVLTPWWAVVVVAVLLAVLEVGVGRVLMP